MLKIIKLLKLFYKTLIINNVASKIFLFINLIIYNLF